MSVITSMISWVICIFAIVSSVAVTIVLWLTYIDIQKTKDYAESTKLEEFVRNETFICATAIIATVIMVKCFAYIHRMKYSIRLGLLFNIHIVTTMHILISKLVLLLILFLFFISKWTDYCNHYSLYSTKETKRFSCFIWRGKQLHVGNAKFDTSFRSCNVCFVFVFDLLGDRCRMSGDYKRTESEQCDNSNI